MNIAGPISALIAANSIANGLLGGRVYANVLLQEGALPAAAISITDDTPNNTKTGPSDLDRILLQIDIYGNTYTEAAQTSDAVRAAIDYQVDEDNNIAGIFFLRTRDIYSDRPQKHRQLSEYSVMLTRSV